MTDGLGVLPPGRLGRGPGWWAGRRRGAPPQTRRSSPGSGRTGLTGAGGNTHSHSHSMRSQTRGVVLIHKCTAFRLL